MKKNYKLIEKLELLAQGSQVPSSSMHGEYVEQMLADNILQKIAHGRRMSYQAINTTAFCEYLDTKYDIRNIAETKKLFGKTSRASLVTVTGDSKFLHHRTMTGFLVNSLVEIAATIHGMSFSIHPTDGTFTFITDYDTFRLPPDVVIIGMENCENFRYIQQHGTLFNAYPHALFVSRYPQNGDLVKWLEQIPNHYIHFGDFDLAGIHIYLTEFYSHLGASRSEFLIPDDINERIPQGSQSRYDKQYQKYADMTITDTRLQPLVDLIHKEHRGYDQEGYIQNK